MQDPKYFVRFKEDFDEAPKALRARINLMLKGHGLPETTVGYYRPQPKYRSWVPKFLIRLITL